MSERPVVLVTGSSRGIGRHLVHHFVERDYVVVGCSRSDLPPLEHARYTHHVVDVGSETEVVAMFAQLREDQERLDLVVNNAAINPTLSLVTLTSATDATQTLATNVIGPFLVCREAIKLMMRRRVGRIVNIGSMATRHEVAGEAMYTASKAALNAFSRVLAKEVAESGITCNVVAPAAVDDGLTRAIDRTKLGEVLARNALSGFGDPAEVADTIEWLARPESASITGQIIYLGGA